MNFIDDMLTPKQNKEAAQVPQGADKETHEVNKLQANAWIADLATNTDIDAVEKEYQEKLAEEARVLGKTAAYEQGDTVEETLKKDYKRDVEILSDYALAEIVAGIRGHQEQNSAEMFHDHKEDVKKEITSNRKKVEEEVLKATEMSAQVDWKKAFERFSKEAKPEEPKEKDLFPKVEEKDVKFDKPSEDKFKLPTKEEMVPAGNGREADERTEVTKQAVPVIKEASKKINSDKIVELKKKADYNGWKNYETWLVALWIDNDQGLQEYAYELAKTEKNPMILGESLKSYLEEMQPELGANLWADLLTAALGAVDWREVGQHYVETESEVESSLKKAEYQPKTGEPCSCRPGMERDNCPACEGTGQKVDFKKIREQNVIPAEKKADEAIQPIKREQLYDQASCEGCPVCGGEGKDLKNNEVDHLACSACGIMIQLQRKFNLVQVEKKLLRKLQNYLIGRSE